MAITPPHMEGDRSGESMSDEDWSGKAEEDDMDDCDDFSFPVAKVQLINKALNSSNNPALQPSMVVNHVAECLESALYCLLRTPR